MNDMAGIIFANENEAKLNELTIHRAIASMPFAGRYRLIDFALSNFVNSSITRIGIVTRSNYSSLMDHIRMGRDWDLNRKNSGIAVFPPFVSNASKSVYKGKIDALEGIIDYISRADEEYFVLANGNIVANIDFNDAFDKHMENKADITVLTHKARPTTSTRMIISKKRVQFIKEVLIDNKESDKLCDISLNIYIISKELLLNIINDAYAKGYSNFENLVFQKDIEKYRVCMYEVGGFVRIIDDIKLYYEDSMRLLNPKNTADLFTQKRKIFTKVKDSVPVVYGDNSNVKNSLIADGCVINGTVENSILFRNVVIEEGAVIKNSIIMEYSVVSKGSTLNYAIADKNVLIKEDRVISGHETYPVVIAKGKQV